MGRSGEYVSNLYGEIAYRSFRPAPLPPEPQISLDGDDLRLLLAASRRLQELDTMAQFIPNAQLFVSQYVRKEALVSSQIEGTQCTLDDLLDPEVESNADLDVDDVVCYTKSLWHAIDRLDEMPLCNRLLREAHAQLLGSGRGSERNPGEFRRSQNWIGPSGCTLKDARYIPPNVDDMIDALADLERYINADPEIDPLIRAALIHYQFETIHPFLDGNGRIGRMLILLYLIDQGMLHSPVLYVSYFLKRNQIEYYDRMGEVRRSGNYEQWIRFFLEAVKAAAQDALESARALDHLHRKSWEIVAAQRAAKSLSSVLEYVEKRPIMSIGRCAEELSLSYNTVASAVRKLCDLGILRETTNASRNRVFAYESYLAVLRRGTEPLGGGR
ncbi:Fic family protein [Adlercreutzia sp. ZJ141]|uniref:Fic family protein n=1 Tax=Adlercreutzia sp. ZJ141 TaxID=2709406 RepID=UPI0013EDA073|nr:Fic family protein [Adlercreutzia sp. ZJ141]